MLISVVYMLTHGLNFTNYLLYNCFAFRKLLGVGLGNCCIEELQRIEQQLELSVSIIRARKAIFFHSHARAAKQFLHKSILRIPS